MSIGGGGGRRPWDSISTGTWDPLRPCDLILQTDDQAAAARLG